MLLQCDQIPTMNKRSKFKLTSVEDNAPGKTGGFKHVIGDKIFQMWSCSTAADFKIAPLIHLVWGLFPKMS